MSLRNGKTPATRQTTISSHSSASSSSSTTADKEFTTMMRQSYQPPRPSPYLLLAYPVILALGSTFSLLSPIANYQTHNYAPPLTPGITSDINTPVIPKPINYFSGKQNLFNIYFVKIGWFWTTLAYVALQVTHRNQSKSSSAPKHHLQSAIRYTLVTLSWIFVTQWFFGPGLIDRSFTLTGGHCESIPAQTPILPSGTTAADLNKLPTIVSAALCKSSGGRWRGGHDISGHVFLLVLSSAFLLYELYISDRHSSHPSISASAAKNISGSLTEAEKRAIGGFESEGFAKARVWARRFVYGVVALDVWMLMMTAIWFHTWLEKLSGLGLAAASLYSVYFLGDFWETWRGVVGGL